MSSPYLSTATDGTDPGIHYANWLRETTIARTGDRRNATNGGRGTLSTGTYGTCAAAYPSYNTITFPRPTGGNYAVTAGSASSLQSQINACAASGNGGYVIVPSTQANRISTNTVSIPVNVNGDTTPGGNKVVVIISKAVFDSIDIFTGYPTVLPEGLRVAGSDQVTRLGGSLSATDVELFAHIQGLGTTTAGAVFDTGTAVANGYRYVGLYVTPDPALTGATPVSRIFRIGTGNNTQNSDALTPKNHFLDRCIVTSSHASQQILHAVDLHGRYSGTIDCDIWNIWEKGNGDCQALVTYNTNGNLLFLNTHFSASDEGLGVGGGGNAVGSLANIELRWCVFAKPDRWNPDHPSFDNTGNASATAWNSGTTYSSGQRVSYGTPTRTYVSAQNSNTNHLPTDTSWWTVEASVGVKLCAEVKMGQNILFFGCIFIGCWVGNQNGDGLNVKHNYSEVGVNRTQDIIVLYCGLEKLATGFRIAGNADDTIGIDKFAIYRIAIGHCLGTEIGGGYYDAGNQYGRWIQTQSVEGLSVDHCTAFATNVVHYLVDGGGGAADGTDGKTNSYTHTNSIYGGPSGFAYFRAGGFSDGKNSLDAQAPSAVLHNNVIAGANSGDYTGTNLTSNSFPANTAAIQFTNYTNTSSGVHSLLGTTQTSFASPIRGRVMMMMRR